MTPNEQRVAEIKERVEKTMCATWSSDGGDQGIQGRISREDFDALMVSHTAWKFTAKCFAAPEAAPEPVCKAVERILDEHSAWISRPSDEVTKAVALAATVAAQTIIAQMEAYDDATQH